MKLELNILLNAASGSEPSEGVTPSILTLFPVGISYGILTVTLTVKFPREVTFSLELICVIDISFISLKVNSLVLEFNLLKGIVDVFLKLFLNVKRSSEMPMPPRLSNASLLFGESDKFKSLLCP